MTAVTSNTLGLLGLAHKAGKLEIGEEPVGAACRARHAKVVLLASDAAENTVRRAQQFSQTAKAPCVTAPFSKAELGWHLLEKLAWEDPEGFGTAAAQLAEAAAKTLQRQKEQAAHARNVRRGKRKPWAAPPRER